MVSTGMAMPLDDLIAADGDEGKAYIDDFLSGFMEDSYVDGKIYSIPFQRSTEILFYNKDAFKVGLDLENIFTVLSKSDKWGIKDETNWRCREARQHQLHFKSIILSY